MTKYRISKGKVVKRDGLNKAGTVYEFAPDPNYPQEFDSVREAKIFYWHQLEPSSPDIEVANFNAFARNMGGIKILKVSQNG